MNGKAKRHSDIDIVLVCAKKLDWRVVKNLKQIFSGSDIPFTVDVIDWHAISAEFKKVIEKNYKTIQ